MKNRYEVRGDTTVIFLEKKDGNVIETLISTSRLDMLLGIDNKWWAVSCKSSKSHYVRGKVPTNDDGSKDTALHRMLAGEPLGMEVDHINHNTLDNRDCNLRVTTTSQNQQNRKGAQINSSSGIRGVHWHKRMKKWEVQIKLNRKKITVGYYRSLEDAEKAAIAARKQYMPYSS